MQANERRELYTGGLEQRRAAGFREQLDKISTNMPRSSFFFQRASGLCRVPGPRREGERSRDRGGVGEKEPSMSGLAARVGWGFGVEAEIFLMTWICCLGFTRRILSAHCCPTLAHEQTCPHPAAPHFVRCPPLPPATPAEQNKQSGDIPSGGHLQTPP